MSLGLSKQGRGRQGKPLMRAFLVRNADRSRTRNVSQLRHHHPQDPSGNIKLAANIGFSEDLGAGQPEGWTAEAQGYGDQAGPCRV